MGTRMCPRFFVIPKEDLKWPERLWGNLLGRTVMNIRSRGDFVKLTEADAVELMRLKFCHDSTISDRDWRKKVIPSLKVFRDKFGQCCVMKAFLVPRSPPWPEVAWGMPLGMIVQSIRQENEYGEYISRDKSQLEAIGFVWNFYEAEWIPSDGNWPEQTWGIKLGNVVSGIRAADAYAAQVSRDKPQLETIGFAWNVVVSEVQFRERILPALKCFYRLHGHSRVPISFEVPSDAAWPEELHGMKLGVVVTSIRRRGSHFDQTSRSLDELEAVEFRLETPVAKWEQRVEPLLTTYEDLHGHRSVPLNFVVPSTTPWEEKEWGIQLGKLRRKGEAGDAKAKY